MGEPLKIRYQSPRYSPEKVAKSYLYIEIDTGIPIVVEAEGGKHKYTIRSYELPEYEHSKYSNALAEAEKIKHYFPYIVDFIKN